MSENWKDYWYKPYNPEDTEFNERARELAEKRDGAKIEINERY